MFFPHKSNRSIPSFARPFLSWELCPPQLISIPYAFRQLNLNSAGVQNTVIISLFRKFCVSIVFLIVTFLFLLKVYVCIYSIVCLLICFVFFYNCSGLLAYLSVGLSSLILRLSFRPFRQGFALSILDRKQ